MPAPNAAIIAIANKIDGKAIQASIIRIITLSSRRKYPDIKPIIVPAREEKKTTLSLHVTVSVEQAGRTWLITDKLKEYYVRKEEHRLNIYDVSEPSAPLIIASPDVEADLTNKLYKLTPLEKRQMYMFLFDEPYYVWLRPKVKLLGFVRKDFWDSFQKQQAESNQLQGMGEK